MTHKLVSVHELSETLSVPPSWVYSRTRIKGPGQIPHIRAGKYVRFDVEAVMDWLRDNGLTDVMIAWTPAKLEKFYPDTAGKVSIGPWPDRNGWSNRYFMTGGACYTKVHEYNYIQRKHYLYLEAMHLIIRDHMEPAVVHEAFCEIKEYRDGLSVDMPIPEHLRGIFREESNRG